MPSVIKIPEELAHELDRLAGVEHKPRTAYVVDVLWRDVRRNKQREALKLSAGAWNPAGHPELARAAPPASSRSGLNPMNAMRTPSGIRTVDGYHPPGHVRYLRSPQRAVWPHPIP